MPAACWLACCGQALFALELVASGDYKPVHVPPLPGSTSQAGSPPTALGRKHGPPSDALLRALRQMVADAEMARVVSEQTGEPHQADLARAANTVLLRRARARVEAANCLQLAIEDLRGVTLASLSLPL